MKALKVFLDEHHIESITLYSFSKFDNPRFYGISCIRPTPDEWASIITQSPPAPGVYVVSAH
jgi:hypothetical protein